MTPRHVDLHSHLECLAERLIHICIIFTASLRKVYMSCYLCGKRITETE
jgi:hypothetical protein